MYGAVGAVTYPTRALNSAAFQGTQQQQQPGSGSNGKQRVFTGTVTKVQDNFGFVDEDVFFQTSCCVKGMLPQVGDRVLVEALYNANMPFKWNATRIQVLPMGRTDTTSNMASMSTGYNAVPPPLNFIKIFGISCCFLAAENSTMGGGGGNRFSSGGSRFSSGGGGGGDRGGRDRGRDRPRQQRDRDDKDKDRLKSPPRKRSKSPPRQRRARRVVPRYSVQVPKMSLDSIEGDVLELRRRYSNMYIPSDFFNAHFSWVDTFPLDKPVSLNFPCSFHIMHKDVEPVISHSDILEPPDMDYLYSAKVMLLSSPGLEEFYSKCVSLAEDRDKEGSRSTDDDSQQFSHPARLISFMVGLRGKNETMAIGGPWSPSLDGENPQSDPGVLIKTATRNCRSLTGIDLSSCTQWFRFLEIHYHRAESVHKGRQVAARVETVVMFVPDVWSCLPTRLEWDGLQLNYQRQCSRKLNKDQPAPVASATPTKEDDSDAVIVVPKREPRHYSELDPKNMKVNELREELEARSLSPKGLKSQLVARLAKVIKTEADEEAGKKETPPKIEKKEDEDKKKKEVYKFKIEDKDKLRGGDKKDDEKKRIEKLKLITVDPLLLLSYVYFDTTRCGYIFDKDLEDLLYSLGLSLSRAQVIISAMLY
ncbi:hypothetical protein AAG570_003903 [Ranatra chinensis]|uniref:SAP domain-containing protein n=1 Tax=Ranatra chinensis TaxID=642074 RepID=A0ABD0YEU0_9HEMI